MAQNAAKDETEFEHDLSKKEFEQREARLRTELLKAQFELMEADFPVLVVVSGTDAAGRSETIDLLNKWLDARLLQTFGYHPHNDEESERPTFWRYWRDLPPKGHIGIYYSGWHLGAVLLRAENEIRPAEFKHALAQANLFEQLLVDDGALVVKLMFHIGKDQLRERLAAWKKDPETSWRVGPRQKAHFEIFDELKKLHEEDIQQTDTPEAPWTLIDGAHPRRRALQAGEELLAALRAKLAKQSRMPPAATTAATPSKVETREPVAGHRLSQIDLTAQLDRETYEKELAAWQAKLNHLGRDVYDAEIPVVIVMEGWDAAGKGGAIRRVLPAIDARQYRVIPVSAPTQRDHQFQYLWRFWRHLPRRGCFTIFDRSWYGRVLVERIEGFATEAQWQRAYEEINSFENQLVEHGTTLVKYWLEIDPDEQIRRFGAREQIGYKKHKIGIEDYRNREKWPQYVEAAEEMFQRTCTETAPWSIVAANNKRFARIAVLKTLCNALEQSLDLDT